MRKKSLTRMKVEKWQIVWIAIRAIARSNNSHLIVDRVMKFICRDLYLWYFWHLIESWGLLFVLKLAECWLCDLLITLLFKTWFALLRLQSSLHLHWIIWKWCVEPRLCTDQDRFLDYCRVAIIDCTSTCHVQSLLQKWLASDSLNFSIHQTYFAQ